MDARRIGLIGATAAMLMIAALVLVPAGAPTSAVDHASAPAPAESGLPQADLEAPSSSQPPIFEDDPALASQPGNTDRGGMAGSMPPGGCSEPFISPSDLPAEGDLPAGDDSPSENRSPHFTVDTWELTVGFEAEDARRLPVDSDYVFVGAEPVRELRVRLNRPADARTLVEDTVSIRGLVAGDVSDLVLALSLEDDGQTVLISLFNPLPIGDRYRVSLSPAVHDLGGEPLTKTPTLEIVALASS